MKTSQEKGDYMKVEHDRIRNQRVDDAMLIDQMRAKMGEIKDMIN